jgi:hypothetical protein
MLLAGQEFGSFDESILLGKLTSPECHPNLLVTCRSADAAEQRLRHWCSRPHYSVALPGPLRLPDSRSGTLFLKRVDELSMSQQIALYDWMSAGRGRLQIASLTTVDLEELVQDGRFLEALFYRLNVVRLEAGE